MLFRDELERALMHCDSALEFVWGAQPFVGCPQEEAQGAQQASIGLRGVDRLLIETSCGVEMCEVSRFVVAAIRVPGCIFV